SFQSYSGGVMDDKQRMRPPLPADLVDRLLNGTSEGIVLVDPDETFIYANPAANLIFGLASGCLEGRNMVEFLSEEDFATVRAKTEERRRGLADTYDLRIRTAKGSEAVLMISATPNRDQSGRFKGVIVVFRDVTERVRMEAELERSARLQEILMRELQHRVKNNLSIVASLVDMELAGVSDPKAQHALRDTVSRIRAMSAVYESLDLAADASSVDFRRFLERLCSAAAEMYGAAGRGIAIAASSELFSLDTKRAVSLGLVANEAIANAFKHAFPGGRRGSITIAFRVESGSGRLEVADDGVGLAGNAEQGLGMRITELLARQVEGELKVESGCGTSLSLTFPL
ncbi:MAG: histidine kinase dimerization/phosphoacceptor domain -containing protein, partial [Spirochaetaceae bacterium]|nr:histidine kinase dimerization/phosphoacceptor domain -containing protein [Spirochaetaceae bacterium]